MTGVRELESPLAAWRSFRAIARASQTLAAAQALQWADRSRHADEHLAWCEAVVAQHAHEDHDLGVRASARPRVVLLLGTDLGLCGPLNRRVADRCRAAGLDAEPTILRVVVGERLAALGPLRDPVVLAAPSSLAAARELASEIAGLIELLPNSLEWELSIVLAEAVAGDGQPDVGVRTNATPDIELHELGQGWLDTTEACVAPDPEIAGASLRLARHARLVAALCRAVTSENEARTRTMGRAYESAQRRIAEQERRLRKLRQEQITQEMLEARQGGRR